MIIGIQIGAGGVYLYYNRKNTIFNRNKEPKPKGGFILD